MTDDPMRALLNAGRKTRGGFSHWLKGAPTHVFAELLTALEADGWRVVPEDVVADARDADAASMQAAFWRARAIELGAREDEWWEHPDS